MKLLSTFCILISISCLTLFANDKIVRQSHREVPVAAEVDLLVLGGTTGGVAAAQEAAKAGASVLVVTP